jgi:hypothetical protein
VLILFIVGICRAVRGDISAVERGGEGAGGGLIAACRGGVGAPCEGGSVAYRDAILSVVDASTVGEDVDVGTFGAEFTVALRFRNNC